MRIRCHQHQQTHLQSRRIQLLQAKSWIQKILFEKRITAHEESLHTVIHMTYGLDLWQDSPTSRIQMIKESAELFR